MSRQTASLRQRRTARFHVDSVLSAGYPCLLDRQASHHLYKVLRSREGDTLMLFNGDGHDYMARVDSVGKDCTVMVLERLDNHAESPLHCTLVQAVSRGDRMDTSVQKSVELGVSCIQPVYSRHSISPLDNARAERKRRHWQGIATSAAEQSGRAVVPRVLEPMTLEGYLVASIGECSRATAQSIVLSPTANLPLIDGQPGIDTVRLLIGPESGLDPDEVALACARGFTARHLGPRVLRTETAGPAALALLQMALGDLSR